ncbi:phage antirepressor KilAC domain-containing protein [Aeromonas veronii]
MTIQQQYQQTKVLTGPLNCGDTITMSSQEIADLVGSRHDNVKVTIERLAKKGVIQLPAMQDCGRINGLGINQSFSVYVFTGKQGKRDSLIVVAQLCPEFTARIVDRWQELEEKLAQPDPMAALNDPATMRGLLLSYSERMIGLEHKVEEMQTDVDALERIAKADGSMCITNAAKHLQVQPKYLFQLLSSKRWIYKRAGGKVWIAYQDKLQSGVLEHKVNVVIRPDGSEKVTEQVLVTAKGIAAISKMLSVAGVAA